MLNTAPRPLTTRMLAQSAYEELRRLIVSGEIAPGTRIHVDELAKQWEISRTPIREAISRLALVDLVTITRNSRTEVTQWSPRDMLERVELIASLATAAIPRQCGGPATKTRRTTTEGSTEVHDFLALCQAMLSRSDRRVSRSAVAAHFAPIAAHFYTTEVAHRFGIDLETDAEKRRRLVAELDDAIRAEAPGRIRAAIDSYLRALAQAHRSESADPHSHCDVHAHA
ncbi:GntR family transcriptional regulator [Leifsonia sp. NPDC058248]|uniref:GntR family transcriptional regulator n=1 Tax=Leifsonia sp. NPDC058248 TaxID=3346402 RepID=UPI0036DA569B